MKSRTEFMPLAFILTAMSCESLTSACPCSVVIAVGYMFRYSAMAQAAKKILKEHNATPLAVIARYACGYSDIKKKDW